MSQQLELQHKLFRGSVVVASLAAELTSPPMIFEKPIENHPDDGIRRCVLDDELDEQLSAEGCRSNSGVFLLCRRDPMVESRSQCHFLR